MKKIRYTILFLVLAIRLDAQVLPQTQYVFNPYLYNPMWVGHKGDMQLYFNIKKQFIGVEGSPTLANVTFEKPFSEQINLGGQLNYLSEGPFSTLNLYGSGSYHFKIDEDRMVLFGLSLGVHNTSFNINKLSDPADQALADAGFDDVRFIGNFGMGYIHQDFTFGLALPDLLPRKENNTTDQSIDRAAYDYIILSAGYTYLVDDFDVRIEPQVLFHRDAYLGNQLEFLCAFSYRDLGVVGGSYRQDFGSSIFVGVNANSQIAINYVISLGGSFNSNLDGQFTSHDLGVRYKF